MLRWPPQHGAGMRGVWWRRVACRSITGWRTHTVVAPRSPTAAAGHAGTTTTGATPAQRNCNATPTDDSPPTDQTAPTSPHPTDRRSQPRRAEPTRPTIDIEDFSTNADHRRAVWLRACPPTGCGRDVDGAVSSGCQRLRLPRTNAPGKAPVCSPSAKVSTPSLNVWRYPAAVCMRRRPPAGRSRTMVGG